IHRSRREPKLEPHAPPCLHPRASRAAVGRAEGRGALRYTDACRGGIVRFIVYGALFIATALPSCSRLDASPSGHVAAAARARAPAVATGASVPLPGAGAVSRNADGPVRESQEAEAASGELPGWQ